MANENRNYENENRNYEVNKIIISGRVVNTFQTRKVLRLSVATVPSGQQLNVPEILFFDENLIAGAKDIHPGDHVDIVACMSTRFRRRNDEGDEGESRRKQQENPYLVGVSVKKQESSIDAELGLDINIGKTYVDENKAILAGEVAGIYSPSEKVKIVTLRTSANGRLCFPRISCFGNNINYVENHVSKGDKVAVYGSVQTHMNKEKDVFYESIVAREIRVLKE